MGRKLRYVYSVGIWFSLLMLLLFPLPGCVPAALSLASATLETVNGNTSAGPPSGQFANVPSAMQERANGDPDIREALAQAEQRNILQECKSKLPPVELSSVTSSCAMRPLCLPGGKAPMRIWVCPHSPSSPTDRRITRSSAWKWDVKGQTGEF
jgi:hypothetical protein